MSLLRFKCLTIRLLKMFYQHHCFCHFNYLALMRAIIYSFRKPVPAKLIDFFIFILLSRESDGGAMRRTNPDSLRSCLCFQVFPVEFSSDFFNLLLARFHQAEIIIVKHLIQGRNNETRLGVEPSTLRSWSS